MTTLIRFLKRWNGHEPGQVDRDLEPGVVQELLRRGIAEMAVAADRPPATSTEERRPAKAKRPK